MDFSLPSPAPDSGGEHCSGTPGDTGSWQMGVELVALPMSVQSSSLQGPWLSPCQTWGGGGQRDRRPCSFKLLPSLPGSSAARLGKCDNDAVSTLVQKLFFVPKRCQFTAYKTTTDASASFSFSPNKASINEAAEGLGKYSVIPSSEILSPL